MSRPSLIRQVFVSILAVALAAVLATGLVARRALEASFEEYLISLGTHSGPGGGMARRVVLGGAEQTFLAGVDRGIVISVVIAVALAAVAALLLARYLVEPLRRLTTASGALAAGDLAHRVEERGPAEIRELGAAFNDMAASIEQGEDLRRRLVTDVAHELRNPIAALRAQIEGIAEGVLPADEHRLTSLVDDVGTLSRLVDDLQELSVAEAGRLRYEIALTDLCGVVETEAGRARALLQPGVTLEVSCPAGGAWVTADEFRIAQVVRNLLSNAARHTGAGSVIAEVAPSRDRVRVTVTDTGEGIDAADLPNIWERFYRADASRAAHTGGTGVGLAIARRIIEDHDGTVFAESTPGAGSAIGFELPLDEVQAPSA